MGRLQKKCFFASACLHGLLLGVLVFGSGFFAGRKLNSAPVLEFIPADALLTDGATTGGGSPHVTTQPAAGSPAQPAPPVAKAEPPKAKASAPEPEPVKPLRPDAFTLPKDTKTTKKKSDTTEKTSAKHETTRDLSLNKKVTRTPSKQTTTKSTDSGKQPSDAASDLARRAAESVGVLSRSLSGGVGVEVPGPGGAAFVNYRDFVASAYQQKYKQAVTAAGDIARGDTSVDVAITIARDGRVVAREITRRSGNTALDRLVQRVLDSVTEIAPFPTGAKDERRTFNLTFELKADRLAG